ncbi:lipoate--protein ligase [Carboxylicivirga sp. M1479]|uniref:lipoate--protein ligase n=1 Tax=Carboxylicivirga sp. M1479 TaxID=2594476 RepID=UPI001177EC8B|nr:lipoate--protein ligase [Carboxylicivirga sp. M1479]TRX71667.1 lipoate--protein ligase [Carboxylicivirga sp. M1479]
MKGLISITNNPAFNLATEEYLLRQTALDIFFLYTNSPSIIVGKHQNTLAEINFSYTSKHKIPVYRRLSGGGTVFHDDNNLNFCFIQTGIKGQLVNFEQYSQPILDALKSLGIDASFGKRHDIQIKNKKVSGNASHVYKSRVMHHGTLLFNSDLSTLSNALKNNPLIIKGKSVKSVRSEVTNISEYLSTPMKYEEFVSYVFKHLLNHYQQADELVLQTNEIDQIKSLVKDKYSGWEWNYGYSPNFEINKRYKLVDGSRIKSRLKIEKGIIKESEIKSSDQSLNHILRDLANQMVGCNHEYNSIKNILYKEQFKKITKEDKIQISDGFFS